MANLGGYSILDIADTIFKPSSKPYDVNIKLFSKQFSFHVVPDYFVWKDSGKPVKDVKDIKRWGMVKRMEDWKIQRQKFLIQVEAHMNNAILRG